jgi:cyclopropane fatty-acyl-phospholipid synthase-like methyltransferase
VEAFGPSDYQFLLDVIEREKVKTVLDIGTGDGAFIATLAARHSHLQVDAIDVNQDLIDVASDRNTEVNIAFHVANFRDWSVSPYDLVMARFAIEHIERLADIEAFAGKVATHLAEDGSFAIIEYCLLPTEAHDDRVWKRFRKAELLTYAHTGIHPRIGMALPAILQKAGFSTVASRLNHLSPATIGAAPFFALVREYVKLYRQVDPPAWPESLNREVLDWCEQAVYARDPAFFTSHTIARRSSA